MNIYKLYFKRILDIFFVALTFPIILSIILFVSALIILFDNGPVFFVHQRLGLNGTYFNLVKFRTMRPSNSIKFDSDKVTTLGRFLRKTSLDEFPVFWNVLTGDMSVVGPRPLLVQYKNRYTDKQSKRHKVRPGVTGLAQLKGRNHCTWGSKLRFDQLYVKKVSFCLDIKIIILTALTFLFDSKVEGKGNELFVGKKS
jgi:lipopolysaccharide/colanic/teichoic acid biosynthesis glycosyltransferase